MAISHWAICRSRKPVDLRHSVDQAPPVWAPEEEKVSYHYYTFGWLIGELLRRVDALAGDLTASQIACR